MNKLILFVYFQLLFPNLSCHTQEQAQNLNTTFKHKQPNQFELRNFFQTNKSTIKTLKFQIHKNANISIHNSFVGPKSANFKIYNLSGGTSLKMAKSRWRPKDGAIEYKFMLKSWANRSDNEICFHYGVHDVYWYSTYIDSRTPSEWPLNPHHNINQPFTTNGHIPVIENLFLNTDGFALILDLEHPWNIHRWQNDSSHYLCFSISKNSNEFHPDHSSEYYSVKFYVLMSRNIRDVYKSLIHDFGHIKLNSNPPEKIVFQEPIFSTESLRYLGDLIQNGVNQRNVEDLARNISGITQFGGAQIQIDEWRDRNKSIAFNSQNYPIPSVMTAKLHMIGHQIGLRIGPTIFENIPIDFTDLEELDYFVDQWNWLKGDQNFTIDSLTVQYCHGASFMRELGWISVDETIRKYPNFISNLCAQAFMRTSRRISINSVYKSQSLPNLFVRNEIEFGDHEIRRMLINSLILSLAGYQFFQPQLIHTSALPPLEWYIRWLQAVTFLPVMHIPVPPWVYPNRSAIGLTRKFVKLHQTLVNWSTLSRRWLKFGEPMIRPMWFAEPQDSRSYRVDDQFMVGDRLVVAPVLVVGQYNRTVYLPKGKWKGHDNRVFTGSGTYVVNAPREITSISTCANISSVCSSNYQCPTNALCVSNLCSCVFGYAPNPLTGCCTFLNCTFNSQCGPNALCLEYYKNSGHCACSTGFYVDQSSQQCTPVDEDHTLNPFLVVPIIVGSMMFVVVLIAIKMKKEDAHAQESARRRVENHSNYGSANSNAELRIENRESEQVVVAVEEEEEEEDKFKCEAPPSYESLFR